MTFADMLTKYSPDQERDDVGRWTSGGGVGPLRSVATGRWLTVAGEDLDAGTSARVRELRIPKGWSRVEINPDREAALQAVGVDSKGRAQYVYSAEHSGRAAAEKFARLREFDVELPELRARIERDVADKSLSPKTRAAAAAALLIERTGFRVGSDRETGGAVKAYGASTLLAEHVAVNGDAIRFSFVGKKGVKIEKVVRDRLLATVIGERARSGGRLFDVSADDVRDYIHARDGEFKIKDFRTWHGTNVALEVIGGMSRPRTARDRVKARAAVGDAVAAHLGNTRAVALSSYVDPSVFARWESGR